MIEEIINSEYMDFISMKLQLTYISTVIWKYVYGREILDYKIVIVSIVCTI